MGLQDKTLQYMHNAELRPALFCIQYRITIMGLHKALQYLHCLKID